MTLDVFTTQIANTGHAQTKSAGNGKSIDGLNAQGLNFFDLFLQNAAAALDNAKTEDDATDKNISIDSSDVTTQGEENLQNLAPSIKILSESTDTIANVESIDIADVKVADIEVLDVEVVDLETSIPVDPVNAVNVENTNIPSLLTTDASITPEEISVQNALVVEDSKSKPALFGLQRFVQKLEKLIENESPALTALNITPEEITDLQETMGVIMERLESGEKIRDIVTEATEENAEDFGGIFASIAQILPPKAKHDIIIKQTGLSQISHTNSQPMNDIGARLNNLNIGVNTENFGNQTQSSLGDSGFDDFEQTLQQILKDAKGGKDGSIADILQNAGKAKSAGPDALINGAGNGQNSALQGWPFSLNGSLFAPINYGSSSYDELGLGSASTNANALSPLTSLVTQSHAAGQPHPGTQMLAANIKKMASNGDTKNIRIQLDPPELGRVEIKMSFGKDKGVKAILTAEKPETFMMMQRDAQILERALQNAGIDPDSSSLSFELAQDEQNFNQDGSHDGSRNQTGGGDAEGNDEEIIESTMTWHVDPDSGHMRYDILV